MATASLHIDAPPERVWRLIADVTRMGEWSPVCYKCEWLDPSSGPTVGAKFKGYNKQGPARWWTICEITESVPGKVFEFRTIDGLFSIGFRGREMARWRYEFEADGIGTNVTETNQLVALPPLLRLVGFALRAQDGQRKASMNTTLGRLKAEAERGD